MYKGKRDIKKEDDFFNFLELFHAILFQENDKNLRDPMREINFINIPNPSNPTRAWDLLSL
jgi:hypothetical protein